MGGQGGSLSGDLPTWYRKSEVFQINLWCEFRRLEPIFLRVGPRWGGGGMGVQRRGEERGKRLQTGWREQYGPVWPASNGCWSNKYSDFVVVNWPGLSLRVENFCHSPKDKEWYQYCFVVIMDIFYIQCIFHQWQFLLQHVVSLFFYSGGTLDICI